jgi:Abortive infection alpha
MTDPISDAKNGIALIGDILKAAGDNPNVKAAGSELGQTALTLTKAVNNFMLPLAAVNFGFDKARKYFQEKFQNEMAAKTSEIPIESIVEPKASIAGPALQGLAFSHEEPDLKNMYLSLLATSMDGRVSSNAHPAFVEIIKQLNTEDAKLLQLILNVESLPIVELRVRYKAKTEWIPKHSRLLMDLRTSTDFQPAVMPGTDAILDNLIRLGLVELDFKKMLSGDKSYDWANERPEYKDLKSQFEDENHDVGFERGVLGRRALGLQFAAAVGLLT